MTLPFFWGQLDTSGGVISLLLQRLMPGLNDQFEISLLAFRYIYSEHIRCHSEISEIFFIAFNG